MKYPVAKPDVSGNELKYLTTAIQEGEISSKGAYVKQFEEAFADYIGTRNAIACSSGTAALTLAVAAMGHKSGEVIVPDFTMIASAWAVSYLGLKPIFVDCTDDLNIDVNRIEEKITDKTVAIMPVHIYGKSCDMDPIMQLAHDYNLRVIEDCAEAHGAVYKGRKVGSIGDMGCFSLFGNKIISTGEGGIITTNDDHLAQQLRHLRSMAFDPSHTFLHRKTGYNFRMTNLQAAVGIAQLERIDEFLAKREQIRAWYDRELGIKSVKNDGDVLWMYGLRLTPEEKIENELLSRKRDLFIKLLGNSGVEARAYFKPMTAQPMYKQEVSHVFAYEAAASGMYLPTYTQLNEEDVKDISNIVKSILCPQKN